MDASAPANEVLESALLRRSARVNATRGALCTPGRRPNATSPMSHLSVAMPRSECLAGGGAVYRGLRGEAGREQPIRAPDSVFTPPPSSNVE